MRRFIGWLGIAASKFHDWRARYGLANEHNALVPRDWWLEPWEKAAILEFHTGHPLEGSVSRNGSGLSLPLAWIPKEGKPANKRA